MKRKNSNLKQNLYTETNTKNYDPVEGTEKNV